MRYAVVIEHTASGGYSAYVPDLPGFGVAAATLSEVKALVSEGVPFHIEDLVLGGVYKFDGPHPRLRATCWPQAVQT